MTYCAWGCVQICDLWAWQRNENKDRNFHASNWLFAQSTHVDVAAWNFACGVMSGRQLYISSFMKISRGVSELWRVENRPPSLTWPMAYTIACTTVQTVIRGGFRHVQHVRPNRSLTKRGPPQARNCRTPAWHFLTCGVGPIYTVLRHLTL